MGWILVKENNFYQARSNAGADLLLQICQYGFERSKWRDGWLSDGWNQNCLKNLKWTFLFEVFSKLFQWSQAELRGRKRSIFPNLCCLKVSPLGLAGESKFGSLSAEYYMKESRLQLSVLGHFWLVGQYTNSRDDWLWEIYLDVVFKFKM